MEPTFWTKEIVDILGKFLGCFQFRHWFFLWYNVSFVIPAHNHRGSPGFHGNGICRAPSGNQPKAMSDISYGEQLL